MQRLAPPPERQSRLSLSVRTVVKVAILLKEIQEIVMIFRLGMEGLVVFGFV